MRLLAAAQHNNNANASFTASLLPDLSGDAMNDSLAGSSYKHVESHLNETKKKDAACSLMKNDSILLLVARWVF